MDFDRIGKWLGLGANLGVLLGLALLIVELSENRYLMKAQIRHQLATGIVDILQAPANNPQLAEALYRAHAGEALSPAEAYQVQLRTNALFRYWEDVHYQYRAGLYDDAEFSRQREAWKASFAASKYQAGYWCRVRGSYSPEFAAEIDGLIENGC
ncbi:MAG: hypothetical protein EP347_07385 [Alphaproteobacteria bacterium]|nr:MAG: hypothetical protein EP347_07385 [Alphaproteobacteria bacterium]